MSDSYHNIDSINNDINNNKEYLLPFNINENIIPLFYNNNIDTSNIKNIVLIDDNVDDYNKFVQSVNLDSYPIVYNINSSTESLKNLLKEKFSNINRVAFVFHDSSNNKLKDFMNNEPLFTYNDLENNVIKYSNNLQFIIDLVKDFNISNLDYLACNTLQHECWNKYYDIIYKETSVIIGASNDLTGNEKYGGNWILENINKDIKNIYFTENIIKYLYTLLQTTISINTTINQSNIDLYSWPVTINGGIELQPITITFGEDLNISGDSTKYFIINSNYIIIDGNNKIVTINGISNYPGLIQNGNESRIGNTNITIKYLGIVSNNSTIGESAGWIGQNFFGKNINNGIINIIDCYSTGIINSYTGGILGNNTGYKISGGTISITNCYSTGIINSDAGGILGSNTGYQISGGTITLTNCYSTGIINDSAGGILGTSTGYNLTSGTITVSKCYSTGIINDSAGGILGSYTGFNISGGTITITNCYSTGIINNFAGGILGASTYYRSSGGSITVNNCYSTGNINNYAGGIYGAFSGNLSSGVSIIASNCYSAGIITNTDNGIFGSNKTIGIEINTYSANGNWNNNNANNNLNILNNKWYTILSKSNIPYLLQSFNYINLSYNINQNVILNNPTEIILNTIGDGNINNTYAIFKQPIYGTLNSLNNNTVIYTPISNFTGLDSFVYYNNSGKAVVSITVGINSTNITQNLFNSYTFPLYLLSNSIINIDENINITGNINKYFIIGGNNITINGNNKIFIIDGINNYPGLIQNGNNSIGQNGYTNIIIQNIGITTKNNSLLIFGGGWLGQKFFGTGVNSGEIKITNCYSSGSIPQSAGGILGSYSLLYNYKGILIVNNCYTIANIGDFAGGIFGSVICNQSLESSIIVTNCYNQGSINSYAGGIFGSDIGTLSVKLSITVTNCYTIGNIGDSAGGIFGSNTGSQSVESSITVNNCYTIGNIGNNAGGIYGNGNISGTFRNCIYNGVPTQTTNIWIDNNAISTIKINDTSPSKWTYYSSNTTIPWLLSSFNSSIYNPNTLTLNYGSSSTSSSGLFTHNFKYSIISIIPNTSYIIINQNTGVLTFPNSLSIGLYTINVLVGILNANMKYYNYNINIYTLYIKLSQTITFNSISTKTYGDQPFELTAYSTSGLPISYILSDLNVAIIIGNIITIISAGTSTIIASQDGKLLVD